LEIKNFLYHQAAAEYWGVIIIQLADSSILPFVYRDTASQLQIYLIKVLELLIENNSTMNLIESLTTSIQMSITKFNLSSIDLQQAVSEELNTILYSAERQFLYNGGLPNRPWYRHMLQAPGLYAGYDADTFPGLTQAIHDMDWNTALNYSNIISQVILNAANFIEPSPSSPPNNLWIVAVVVVVVLVFVGIVVFVIVFYRRRRAANYQKLRSG